MPSRLLVPHVPFLCFWKRPLPLSNCEPMLYDPGPSENASLPPPGAPFAAKSKRLLRELMYGSTPSPRGLPDAMRRSMLRTGLRLRARGSFVPCARRAPKPCAPPPSPSSSSCPNRPSYVSFGRAGKLFALWPVYACGPGERS